jgi:hypothetical protein
MNAIELAKRLLVIEVKYEDRYEDNISSDFPVKIAVFGNYGQKELYEIKAVEFDSDNKQINIIT